MSQSWLGIDIGGTSTRLLTLQGQDKWLGFRKIATASWATRPHALAALADLIKTALEGQPVTGVMLGLPGILSRDRQHVISLPFIQALDGIAVAAQLSERAGVPVAMDKDVNHLMLWDLLQLEQLPDNAIGLYLGTGLGNSLWLNGQFYHGERGASGELGHIPWADNDLPCPCGNQGCAETLTSGHWLSQWARRHCPQSEISQLFTLYARHPELQLFISRLAKIIASEINILDPQYLILGGGVLAMADFPLTQLCSQIKCHLRPPATSSGLQIIISRATDQTGCRGACLAAKRHFGGSL